MDTSKYMILLCLLDITFLSELAATLGGTATSPALAHVRVEEGPSGSPDTRKAVTTAWPSSRGPDQVRPRQNVQHDETSAAPACGRIRRTKRMLQDLTEFRDEIKARADSGVKGEMKMAMKWNRMATPGKWAGGFSTV